jgi:prevent-host-death family protein
VKLIEFDNLKENPSACIDDAQSEHIVVTRHGKPAVLIIGLEDYDAEDWGYMTDLQFWTMIADSRTQPDIQPRGSGSVPPPIRWGDKGNGLEMGR